MEVEEFNKPQDSFGPVETQEETAEEKQEKVDKFLRSAVIHKHKTILQDIYSYIHKNNLNLEQLKKEIEEKKCRLTASRREFIVSFKLDFIQQLFDDIEERKNGNNKA